MAAGTLGSLVLEIGTNIAKLRGDMEQSVATVREAMEKIGGQIDFVETAFKRLGEAATIGNGSTVGFNCASAEQADAWHAAGVAAGGTSIEEPPGVRAGSTGKLYLAYLRDPDGNKLCALHRM